MTQTSAVSNNLAKRAQIDNKEELNRILEPQARISTRATWSSIFRTD